MERIIRTICAFLTLATAGTFFVSLAEDEMPIVVDQPYTKEELAEIEEQKKEKLRQAQQMLIDLGYLTGRADGLFGPRTEQALKAFQSEYGLEATGELDDGTLRVVEETAEAFSDSKALQQRLIDLGYLRGQAHGIFAERSRAALKLFQTLQGLEPTGMPDGETREKLFDQAAQSLPGPLGRGDKGEAVTALQERLIRFGFMNGEADGSYGKKTASGVSIFQKHLLAQGVDENLGIEATGEATAATRMLLMDEGYSSYVKDIEPGEQSDEVTRVERRLGRLGYMDAQADDVFDDYAVRTAEAFRDAAGLGEGGFDKTFIDALFAVDAPATDHFVLHDIAYGDRGVAVKETARLLMADGMTVSLPDRAYGDSLVEAVERLHEYLTERNSPQAALFENAAYLSVEAQQAIRDGVLRYISDIGEDSEESEIKRVQRRLHTLYYLSKYAVDGKYGDATQNAVKAFQQTNGLADTGVVDMDTQRALFWTEAKHKLYPYRVEVDIDSQRVYVFKLNDSEEYEQIQTFVCSTGLGNTTPRGIFLNGYPANRWHHFEKYKCWAQYSFEIEGNILFHSVIYSSDDVSTLRQGSVYALGSKASHGCIRLSVKDAKWLFEHCKRGSLVIVIY